MNIDDLNAALSDRYRIERELGRGGMAIVYLAHDWNLGRDVALKVLLPELAASLGGQRFLREIEIAAKLSHPNILSLHDRGEVDGLLYYTMPYVEGESLRDRLDREKQLPMDEALRIASQVAEALQHAHEQGVVHRDIKPENILLQGDHALVADFGIARAVTEAGGEKLTQTGIAVGTVTYMAPEQSSAGKDVDARSDLYSLGCVLYEMIGGEPPFTGPSAQAIMARHALDPPPSVSTIRPATPPGVEEVILRALAKNAVDRYKTAEHMRVVLSDPEIAVVRLRGRLSRLMRTRPARAVLGVAATAAVAFGVWRVLPNDSTVANPSAGVVVVLPFEVDSVLERPFDAVSITNLLRNYFSYTDRYRVVPAELVRQTVERLCPTPPIERFCGSRVATELGAQFHVTGSVTPVRRDSMAIVAIMTDEMEGRSIPPVSIRGSRENAYEAISRLYRELAASSAGEGEPVPANAALSTESDEAFAALLDGELYLADFVLDSAENAFRRAVDADSAFALAWYRLAIIYDWQARPAGQVEATTRAMANADKLAPRQQRVIEAFSYLIAGQVDKAEPIYLELLEQNPGDVEALFQYGMLLWAYNWRRGRSMTEAQQPLQRVIELAPRHSTAARYLALSLAATPELDAMDSVAAAYPDLAPTVLPTTEAIRALRRGDSAGFVAALNETTVPLNAAMIVTQVLLGTQHDQVPDLGVLANLVRPFAESDFMASWWLASLEAGRGRWAEARDVLERANLNGEKGAVPLMVHWATLPVMRPAGAEPDSLLAWIDAWGGGIVYEDLIRLYLKGLLAAGGGDHEAARAYADQLEARQADWEGDAAISVNRTTPIDLAQGIRADVLWREGKPGEALAALERARWELNYNEAWFSWVAGGVREMFLRARLLQDLGRYQEALALFDFGTEGRVLHMAMLAPAHFYRGEIYEELGDIDKAMWHYGAFVELWGEADPEYQMMVEEVKGRMARLVGE